MPTYFPGWKKIHSNLSLGLLLRYMWVTFKFFTFCLLNTCFRNIWARREYGKGLKCVIYVQINKQSFLLTFRLLPLSRSPCYSMCLQTQGNVCLMPRVFCGKRTRRPKQFLQSIPKKAASLSAFLGKCWLQKSWITIAFHGTFSRSLVCTGVLLLSLFY